MFMFTTYLLLSYLYIFMLLHLLTLPACCDIIMYSAYQLLTCCICAYYLLLLQDIASLLHIVYLLCYTYLYFPTCTLLTCCCYAHYIAYRSVPIIGSAKISATNMVIVTNIGISTEQQKD